MSKEVVGLACPGTIYDGSSMESFSFHGGSVNNFGRCFIEVLFFYCNQSLCSQYSIGHSHHKYPVAECITLFLTFLAFLII